MSDPHIVLDRLRKDYGRTIAVDDLSMSIPRGEIFGFLGANGAGKTTTIRMLCGLTKPSGGQARIGGRDSWHDRRHVRQQFGYVAQKFSLYPDLTVLENLRFFGAACRLDPGELARSVADLLDRMDLRGKRDAAAGSLSGGMKQLLAMACALVHRPPLLFLDEPTSGLDPVHRQQIWNLLYDLSHEGTTIFVTTHYMDEADRCTEVGFLDRGRLLAKETPQRLKGRFRGQLLELEIEPVMPALVSLRGQPGVLDAVLRGGRVRLYAAQPAELLDSWRHAWPFPALCWSGHRWVDADMEDVFKACSQGFTELLSGPEP
jgi:ABC-2 type transport system ATP-binding protein